MLYFERGCLDLFPRNFARYLISFFLALCEQSKTYFRDFSWSNFFLFLSFLSLGFCATVLCTILLHFDYFGIGSKGP